MEGYRGEDMFSIWYIESIQLYELSLRRSIYIAY